MKSILIFLLIIVMVIGSSLSCVAQKLEKTPIGIDEIESFQSADDGSLNQISAGGEDAPLVAFALIGLAILVIIALS